MSTDAQNDSLFTRLYRSWFGIRLVGPYTSGTGGANERRDEADRQSVHRPFVRDIDRPWMIGRFLRPDLRAPAAGFIAAGRSRGAGARAFGAAIADPAGDCVSGVRPGFDQRRRERAYRDGSPRTRHSVHQRAPLRFRAGRISGRRWSRNSTAGPTGLYLTYWMLALALSPWR